MKILKFGGTSVGDPSRMKRVLEIISGGDGKIVVLSAVSGTTDKLVSLTNFISENRKSEFERELENLHRHYQQFIDDLFETDDKKSEALKFVEEHFGLIRSFANDVYTSHEEKIILAQGELLSTGLFHLLCSERNVASKMLSALDFMRINNENEPDDYYIKINLNRLLEEVGDKYTIITQGFICRNAYGEVDNLRRGGSDYTASLIGSALKAEEIQIWTDIDGMHNNDPRFVDGTFPIKELTYDEAAELAYFGAKILHPSSIRPAKNQNIPVRLKSTLNPELEGTLISKLSGADRIKAIAAKDGITAIKIQSGRMLMAYGFLRKVFEIFEWYKTPIDLITTSEVAVSVTIDDDTQLNRIVEDLKRLGNVEVDRDQTIICVVGDFITSEAGEGAKILNAIREIPLRMVSYGGSANNISFLVDSENKKKALIALNSLFGV